MPHASHSGPFSDLPITSQECDDDGFSLKKQYEMGVARVQTLCQHSHCTSGLA